MSEAYKIDEYYNEEQKSYETTHNSYNKKHHRKKLPLLYKTVYFSLSLVMILMACYSISLENDITSVSAQIEKQEQSINKQKVVVKELEQEESELSKVSRIMSIAQKYGLKMDNSNIKVVEK